MSLEAVLWLGVGAAALNSVQGLEVVGRGRAEQAVDCFLHLRKGLVRLVC